MKKIMLSFLMLLSLGSIAQEQRFQIQGKISGLSPVTKAYLVYQLGTQMVIDSGILKNGNFRFSGRLKGATDASLLLGHRGSLPQTGPFDSRRVYLENGLISIEGKDSLVLCKVTGTKLNADYQKQLNLLKGIPERDQKAQKIAMAGFVNENPGSLVGLDWMYSFGGTDSTVAANFHKLSAALKSSPQGKELGIVVKGYLASRIGRKAPDFSLKDPKGKLIRLADYKGKYVLLDFWASWCKPCRALQPVIAGMYQEWKDSGKFMVISISLDKDRPAWLKALEEDKMSWPQVADLDVPLTKVAELFGVGILPTAFLIDPDGKIISHGLSRDLLRRRLGKAENDSLTVHGRLKRLRNQEGRLIPWDTKQLQVKVSSADDEFSFKIKKQTQPVGFNLQFFNPEAEPNEGIRFFAHQSDLMITGDFEKLSEAKVSGDMTNEDFGVLKDMLSKDIGEEALSAELGKLDYQKDSAVFYDLIRTKGVAMAKEKLLMRRKFIADHPGSFVSMSELLNLPEMYTTDSYTKAYAGLSPAFKATMEAGEIGRRIEQLKVTASGKQAVDFSRKDQFGKSIKLSDFKGKLVLLDFWGSWCKPCRETHPHLKELYERYKDKGLEILAVAEEKSGSLAEKESSWKAAIKKDGINWVHVMNAGGKDLDIVKAYGITAFPTKLLLDKDGKILLRATSGFNEEIDEMIIRLLGK